MTGNIHWLGHDSFRVAGSKNVYIDPFKIKKEDIADIILITHGHFDHCSPADVRMLQGPRTIIVTTADCAKKLSGNIRVVSPGNSLMIDGVEILAVPAYNIAKKFHPKSNNWVGYVFNIDGKRIYHAGDTDNIPETKNIRADIALLPVSGTYVMDADEAAQAAVTLQPKVAIPMHYGSIIGNAADAEQFKKKLLGKVEVVILREEQ